MELVRAAVYALLAMAAPPGCTRGEELAVDLASTYSQRKYRTAAKAKTSA
jgi:hypothetical protein